MTPPVGECSSEGRGPLAEAPLVTAVVASFNEERHIRRCLEGLLGQRNVPGEVEILVIDGGSRDSTREIVRSFPQFGDRVRLLENPRRFQVYAWNIGTRAARGHYIALISAHTEYGPEYLARCLSAHHRSGAANVSGVQFAVGDGSLGRTIAWAMQSPFGVGNASFRYTRKERYVNHAFCFFLEKQTIERLGGFDESFPVNEDCEFNYRLCESGGRVFVSPTIQVRYHARSSLPGLARQMFRYGYWRRRTQLKHPRYVPRRVYVPPLTLAALFFSAACYGWSRHPLAFIIPVAYVVFLSAAAAKAASELPLSAALPAPVALFVMHASYGAGWWCGFFSHRRAKL